MPPHAPLDDYQTALAHGWTCRRPNETLEVARVRCAQELARDMLAYRLDSAAYVSWEDSDLPWDGCEPYDGPLYDAVLYIDETVVGSLGCIAVDSPSDGYALCIEGEMYGEYVRDLEERREACLVRGEN